MPAWREPHTVLRVREAALVAGLLLGGAVLVSLARQHGMAGLMLGTALAAVADAHAPMATLMSLFGAGQLSATNLMVGLLVALSVNGVTRSAAAVLAGGWRFGLVVALVLALNMAVAWAFVLMG